MSAELTQEELLARLAEAEQALEAIRSGAVDAIVVHANEGPQVFTLEGADRFYRVLIEQMPEGAAATDAEGRVLYANERLADMLGVPRTRIVEANLLDMVSISDQDRVREMLAEGDAAASEIVVVRPDDTELSVILSVRTVEDEESILRCVVAVDLSERRAAESAQRAAEARFRGAFDNAPIGMALLDLDGRVVRVNRALCVLAQRRADQLIGSPLPWVDAADAVRAAQASRTAGGTGTVLERPMAFPDGRTGWASIELSMVRDGERRPSVLIAQVQNVTAQRRHEEQLRYMADHDPLTNLLNRRGFEAALEQHLQLIGRYGAEGALVLLDVDNFKYINDTRGHHVGDQVLVRFAETLRRELRASDVIARLGGDEFAILLPRGGATEAKHAVEHLLDATRTIELGSSGKAGRLTASAGIVVVDGAVPGPGALMAQVDLAMYDAKDAGRDRAVLYESTADTPSATERRLTWLSRIEDALEADRFELFAQPIIDVATGAAEQLELLVRVPDDSGTPVAAGAWFEIAERYGLARAIDAWVVENGLEMVAGNGDTIGINLNVSAASVGQDSFVETVNTALRRTGIDPRRVTFEITETAAIRNMAVAVRFSEQLRALGCRLALDDFGAGFGSFYYLKHLPFDDIKIDGEFIRDSVRDSGDQAIIKAMVDVARTMGRRTVAEAIEDERTLALVRDYGVDLAQGYHIGRPAPLAR